MGKEAITISKAEENITEVNDNEIKNLVKAYRESLFINSYKERLIKQQLDTIIAAEEVATYYNKNKENFKLNEELFQLDYIFLVKTF
ncbi:hypothetical protein [Tenacibaculum maritimum]|uniref:hypothetical protein n=1 Tax=Tenacibaculum maritimum TaxID=107401 RepID=UPI00388FFDEF